MPNTKISNLPSIGPLGGLEEIPLALSGNTYKTTPTDIFNFVNPPKILSVEINIIFGSFNATLKTNTIGISTTINTISSFQFYIRNTNFLGFDNECVFIGNTYGLDLSLGVDKLFAHVCNSYDPINQQYLFSVVDGNGLAQDLTTLNYTSPIIATIIKVY